MAAKLTLYTNPISRGRIARWMVEESGAEYDTVLVSYSTSIKAPDYLEINPMGKVPAIRHGDTVVIVQRAAWREASAIDGALMAQQTSAVRS